MSIKFACSCGKAYKVPEKFAGKRVKCKQCGEALRVPSESETSVASSRAAAVSKRSVLASDRLDTRDPDLDEDVEEEGAARPASGHRSDRHERRPSGREQEESGRRSRRTSGTHGVSGKSGKHGALPAKAPAAKPAAPPPARARAGSGTGEFAAVDLLAGNLIKAYQRKRDEEFKRGEGRLTYFEDEKPVKAFRISAAQEYTIGRDSSCDVALPCESVSGQHFKLEYKLGSYIVTDLQSLNGVVVNGRRVKRGSVKSGDVIQCGEAVLRLDC